MAALMLTNRTFSGNAFDARAERFPANAPAYSVECPSCHKTVNQIFVVESAVRDNSTTCPVMCAECRRRYEGKS